MVFSSVLFLCYFLPFFLIAFYTSPSGFKKNVALVFSFAFYAWGAPVFIFYLVGSCIIDFWLSKKASDPANKLAIVLSLVLNIGLLAWFKYANFFAANANYIREILGYDSFSFSNVVLPVGISFFTFQKISYILDVRMNKEQPLKSFRTYLLYITLFPQLIAGPIIRFREIRSQLENWSQSDILAKRVDGIFRFIIGLSKKVLIANVVGEYASEVYATPSEEVSSLTYWLATLAYAFQIYFDFSGYSDMAIGLGKMIGLDFPENFNFPYLARSVTNFWQRWHITLSNWMRDYVYIPLGGNRKGNSRTLINLSIVFLLSGFWHGAAWKFMAWGAFHGLFLILERVFLGKLLQRLPSALSIGYTFVVVLFSWVLFSADNINHAKDIVASMCSLHELSLTEPASAKFLTVLVIAGLFSFVPANDKLQMRINEWLGSFSALSGRRAAIYFAIGIALLYLCIVQIYAEGFNPFIYYRF